MLYIILPIILLSMRSNSHYSSFTQGSAYRTSPAVIPWVSAKRRASEKKQTSVGEEKTLRYFHEMAPPPSLSFDG